MIRSYFFFYPSIFFSLSLSFFISSIPILLLFLVFLSFLYFCCCLFGFLFLLHHLVSISRSVSFGFFSFCAGSLSSSSSPATRQFSLRKFKPGTPSGVATPRCNWFILIEGPRFCVMVLCRHGVPRTGNFIIIRRKGQRN